MRFKPECAGGNSRINPAVPPPSGFITAAMNLAMLASTQWDGELIADLYPAVLRPPRPFAVWPVHPRVLQEFYVQATRRDAPPHDIAIGLIETWLRFRVQETSISTMTGALEIKAQYGLSYWDAAMVAAARALGCRELHSEDLTHGREIDDVTIINPFRCSPVALAYRAVSAIIGPVLCRG